MPHGANARVVPVVQPQTRRPDADEGDLPESSSDDEQPTVTVSGTNATSQKKRQYKRPNVKGLPASLAKQPSWHVL